METPEKENEGNLRSTFAHTFRSLSKRNYRLYFCGQLISVSGTWMQGLALSWLVYKVTHSPVALGIVEFCQMFPVLVLAIVGGWAADHLNRKFLLVTTQALMLCQAAVLAWLTLQGVVQYWHIVILALVAGTVTAFEMPARQSMIPQLVDKEDLVNAISLNSSLFNGARVVGPAIGAFLVSTVGEGYCFLANALSYVGSLVAFSLLSFPVDKSKSAEKKSTGILEGFKFAFSHPEIARLLRLSAVISLFGVQFGVLLPPIIKDVMHMGVDGFGAIRSTSGVGSMTAALLLASRGSGSTLLKSISSACLGFALALAAFSLSNIFLLSLAIALLMGFCLTWQMSASHSVIQINTDDRMRGRIMSIWTMVIMGLSPLGSLLIGWIASLFGPSVTLFACSMIVLVSALIFAATNRAFDKEGTPES